MASNLSDPHPLTQPEKQAPERFEKASRALPPGSNVLMDRASLQRIVDRKAENQRSGVAILSAVLLLAILGIGGLFYWHKPNLFASTTVSPPASAAFNTFIASYPLPKIPDDEFTGAVSDNLRKLMKDPCSWKAISTLSEEISRQDDKQLAAEIYLAFPQRCDRNASAEREAANLYDQTGQFRKARSIYRDLVTRFPQNDLDWYHKGQTEHKLGLVTEAIESFTTSIALDRDPPNIGEWVFTELSEIYASVGRLCEAIEPLTMYVSLDPTKRDNTRTKRLISNYASRGHCSYSTGTDSFAVINPDVINVRGTINGKSGLFTIDTGASFLAVTPDFAARAGLLTTGGTIMTTTANGDVEAKLLKPVNVNVGHLEAEGVPAIMLQKPLGQVDGLLGRSFLARFDMTVTKQKVTFRATN